MPRKSAATVKNRSETSRRVERTGDLKTKLPSRFDLADLPDAWIAIAERPRALAYGQPSAWRNLVDAPIGMDEAHALAAKGMLMTACRHTDSQVVLVIRPRREPDD